MVYRIKIFCFSQQIDHVKWVSTVEMRGRWGRAIQSRATYGFVFLQYLIADLNEFGMRFGQALNEITIPQWKQCYINYQILKIFVSIIKILAQLRKKCDQAMNTVRQSDEASVSISIQDSNSTIRDQLKVIKREIDQYLFVMNREFYRIFFIQTEIMELFYQMKTLEIEDRYRVICRLKGHNFKDRKMELYLTYIEYAYIEISYLAEMREANLEAERKILKKHKKYAKNVVMTPSQNHDKIARMAKIQQDYTNKIEDLYVEQNKHLQSKEARQFLRLAAHKEQPSEKDYFFMGFGVGASIVVLGTLIFIILYQKLSVENTSVFARDFPTWRGIAIFILYNWVLGFNLYFFQKYKISHRLIFKFNDHHYSTSAELLKLAGIFTTIFLALFLLYLLKISNVYNSQSGFRSEYYVLLVYGAVFIYLLMPLPIFNHRGRIFALKLIGQSLISPIFGVTFSIAWMTDQWISLSTPLRDLAYTICYYTRLDFNDVKKNPCTASSTVQVVLLVIIFPIIYRFLQCIRWGISDGFWCTNHMFNAIKYAVSFGSAMLSYFYKIHPSLLGGWIAVAAVSTLYSYYWDLKKDWNLLEPNCRHFLLRKHLTFQPRRNYYIVFVANFIMRLSWAITLSPAITSLFGDPNLVVFVTGSIEIIRRGIWNLLRVEREHINNCVEFKAIPDMFHIEQSLSSDYIPSQGVMGVRNKQHIKSRQIVKKQFIELIKKKLEKREAEEKQFNEDYEEKNTKKAKKIGKKLKGIIDKFKKEQ